MGRAKISMEPITNHKTRKICFNTRSNSMIQKARQLATLCDINVSMILYTEYQQTPQIFPSDHDKLSSLINDYKRTDPEKINYYAISDYYTDRKNKIEEDLVKEKKKSLEARFPSWFDFLDSYSEAGLREFLVGLDNKITDVQSRIEIFKSTQNNITNLQMSIQSCNPNLMDNILMPPSHSLMLNVDDDSVIDEEENSPSMEHRFQPESWNQFL